MALFYFNSIKYLGRLSVVDGGVSSPRRTEDSAAPCPAADRQPQRLLQRRPYQSLAEPQDALQAGGSGIGLLLRHD
jgi:hypothetical protein